MIVNVREDSRNQLVYREVEQMPTKMQQVFRRALLLYVQALKKRANYAILHGVKTGRVYRIRTAGGRYKRHRASSPGQSHANLTGRLRRSLSFKVKGWESAEFGYGVASNAENVAPAYAGFVEFGTRRMEPRPSLQNAIDREGIDRHAEAAFDREFGK